MLSSDFNPYEYCFEFNLTPHDTELAIFIPPDSPPDVASDLPDVFDEDDQRLDFPNHTESLSFSLQIVMIRLVLAVAIVFLIYYVWSRKVAN